MADDILISLAGRFGVEVDGSAIDGAGLGHLGKLAFAYLVLERGRPVSRSELAEVVWEDDLPVTWESALRSLLTRLRRWLGQVELPGDSLVAASGCYQLRLPGHPVVDVERARSEVDAATEALARGDWTGARAAAATATALTAQPFLPGAKGHWVEQRQAELDELHVRALELLAEAASIAGSHAEALAAAEKAVALQPLRESSHLQVMAAHDRAGNRGEALRAYERCRRLLAEEIGALPSPQTQAAYVALLDDDPPPAAPAGTNLHAEVTSFVGRHAELAAVEELLLSSRLVTLTGPGGVGKSRLARRVSANVGWEFPHGVWLVELAALTDPHLVAQVIGSELGLPQKTGPTTASHLAQHLEDRQLLIVLDNCEHLLDACGELVSGLIRACPALRVLTTSQAPLGVAGEHIWPVPTLAVPPAGDPPPEALLTCDAVRLFVERARAVAPGLTIDDGSLPAVAEICQRLDGLPLAIELAAARCRSLSPAEIADRLKDRFRLLVHGDRSAHARHRTLRAAVDWSYDALSPFEQRVFTWLSVFAGGFTLTSAEAVCTRDASEELDVLDALAALVDRSLVATARTGVTTRYRLLETLRQFAADRLRESDEESCPRDRHLAWARRLVEQAALEGPEQARWLATLDAEEDNLRAALEWACATPGRRESGLQLATTLWRYWEMRYRYDEGGRWLATLIDGTEDVPADLRAKALNSAAILAFRVRDIERARAYYEECLVIRRALGDRPGVASALLGLGNLLTATDPDQAAAYFEETAATGREIGEPRLTAASLTNLAATYMSASVTRDGDRDLRARARALYAESVELWRALGDTYEMARTMTDLAGIVERDGDQDQALALREQCAAVWQELGDRPALANTMMHLARIATERGDHAGALARFEEALAIRRELRSLEDVPPILKLMGYTRWRQGDHHGAEVVFAQALELARQVGHRLPAGHLLVDLGVLSLVAGDLGDARRRFSEANAILRTSPDERGRQWPLVWMGVLARAEGDDRQAVEQCLRAIEEGPPRSTPSGGYAIILDVAVQLAAAAGDHPRAARLRGGADAFLGGSTFTPHRDRPEYQHAIAESRRVLGDARFEELRAEGEGLPVDEALALTAAELRRDHRRRGG